MILEGGLEGDIRTGCQNLCNDIAGEGKRPQRTDISDLINTLLDTHQPAALGQLTDKLAFKHIAITRDKGSHLLVGDDLSSMQHEFFEKRELCAVENNSIHCEAPV